MAEKNNFTVNFYEVLGVEQNAPLKEIKKQYTKLVVKYHPDKNKDPFESSLFELIQRAYDTLGNEEKRKEYDFFMKNMEMSRNNDHMSLKANYEKFKDLVDTQPKTKEGAQIEFDKVFTEFDNKHGIDRSALGEKIDKETIGNKLDDLILQREQEEIEFTQNTIFKEGENFDISRFNAAFDFYKNTTDKQMIKKADIQPFNFDKGSSFSGLDVYDKTYQEDDIEGNNMYSHINNIGKINRIDKDKIKNLGNADYTLNHNLKDQHYEEEIKRKMQERDMETEQLKTMKYNQFNNEDKSFQFSQDVGITDNMLEWGNSEDLLTACKKLIALEKKKS